VFASSGVPVHFQPGHKGKNSPIDTYNPSDYRDALLGYVLAHEIGHVLEGLVRHSGAGVMKASWNRADSTGCHFTRPTPS
jgi:hypothetical protein